MTRKELYQVKPPKWREYLSYNTYVPITCDDILHLQPLEKLMKFLKQPYTKTEPVTQYFFGNHPMKWVRVAGRVVHIEVREQHAMLIFRLIDGFGSASLSCVLKSVDHNDIFIEENELIVAFGEISTFGGEIQVATQKILRFPASNALRYYALREEAMEVRKHFLERSADEFKLCLKPVVIPQNSITQLDVAEVTGLRKSLTDRLGEWGFNSFNIVQETPCQYP